MPEKWIQDDFRGGKLNGGLWNFVFMGSPGSRSFRMEEGGGICLTEAARQYAGACGILTKLSLEKSRCSVSAVIEKFDYGAAVALYDGLGGWDHYLQLTLLQGRVEVRIPGGVPINDNFMAGAKKYHVLFRREGKFTYPCTLELRRSCSHYTVLYNGGELGCFEYAGMAGCARAMVKSLRDPRRAPDVPVSHTVVKSVLLKGIADTVTQEGAVVDSSGNGILDAEIHVAGYDRTLSARTDRDGRFRLTGMPPGENTLVAAAEGYLFTSRKTSAGARETQACSIVLEKETPLNIPRREYNRPDFDRSDDWVNLNGTWEFEFDRENAGETEQWFSPGGHRFGMLLQVPFSWSSLQAHGEGFLVDNNSGLEASPYYSDYRITGEVGWYRRKFTVPESFSGRNAVLKIGASNAVTKVWCDGRFVGMSAENYGQIDFDLGKLEPAGTHQLVVRVQFPYDIDSINLGKQHWWFTQCPGVWQTVWLEPRGDLYLDKIKTDYDVVFAPEGEASARVSLSVGAAGRIGRSVWKARDGGGLPDPQADGVFEFVFESESAGCRFVDFVYAAADGECVSKISVNGREAAGGFRWAGTLGWDTWEHARLILNLRKGENRLTVRIPDGELGRHRISFRRIGVSGVLPAIRANAAVCRPDRSPLGNYALTLVPEEGTAELSAELSFRIDAPELWDAFKPNLYTVRVELSNASGGAALDRAGTYFGLRKIEERWAPGHSPSECADPKDRYKYFYLNNRPFYMAGVLDQGYNPWGIYTYRSFRQPQRGSIRYDIDKAREFGYNTLRMHIKENEPLWYYYCDLTGMPVWTEHPGNRNAAPENGRWDSMYRRELFSMIERNYCHPCILIDTTINESWGLQGREGSSPWDIASRQDWQREMALLCKKLDKNRLVCDNSGFGKTNAGEINDFHLYPRSYDASRKDWTRVADQVYPGSSYNYYNEKNGAGCEGSDLQTGAVALISEFIHTDGMDQEMRLYPRFGGYVRMNLASYQGEDYSPLSSDRFQRQSGFLAPDFSDAGYGMVNRPDIILIDSGRHVQAAAGSSFCADVYVSHFGTADLRDCTYEWKLMGIDLFGNTVAVESLRGAERLHIPEYTVEKAGTIRFRVPGEIAGGYLFVELKSGGGSVSTNYICLDVTGGKTLRETDGPAVFSAPPSDALKSEWDAFGGKFERSGRSVVWGKDNGFYEYVFRPLNDPEKKVFTKGRLLFEAATRECLSGVNMTDEIRYPTTVTAFVNGKEAGTVKIEDDPFDERALFTCSAFGGKPYSQFNLGQFGYGYLISMELSREIVEEINAAGGRKDGLTVRFEAAGGGMTLYGCHTGRYGIDPMLLFV